MRALNASKAAASVSRTVTDVVAAAAAVGRADDVRIAPEFGVVRVAGVELADDGPDLAVELERRADLDAGRTARARPCRRSARAGRSETCGRRRSSRSGRSSQARSPTPRTSTLASSPRALLGQRGDDHELGRGDRLPLRVLEYLGHLRDQRDLVVVEHRIEFGLRAGAHHDGGVVACRSALSVAWKPAAIASSATSTPTTPAMPTTTTERRAEPLRNRRDADLASPTRPGARRASNAIQSSEQHREQGQHPPGQGDQHRDGNRDTGYRS